MNHSYPLFKKTLWTTMDHYQQLLYKHCNIIDHHQPVPTVFISQGRVDFDGNGVLGESEFLRLMRMQKDRHTRAAARGGMVTTTNKLWPCWKLLLVTCNNRGEESDLGALWLSHVGSIPPQQIQNGDNKRFIVVSCCWQWLREPWLMVWPFRWCFATCLNAAV